MDPDWRAQTGEEGPDARAQVIDGGAGGGIAGIPLLIPPGLLRRRQAQLLASDLTPLGNTEARDIALGWNGGAVTAWPVMNYKYWYYLAITEKPAHLVVSVALAPAGPWAVLFSHTDAIGGTLLTPYTLPTPYNRNGFLVIGRPYLSIQIADTAGAAHTYTRLFVRVWN
jgi:hypothetical protein